MRRQNSEPGIAATRQVPATILDLRLWAGAGLLALAGIGGALLLGRGSDTIPVWRATHDLSAGATATGLERVEVSRALAGDRYATPGDAVDAPVRWPIRAGELVPLAALGTSASDDRRVTVPVDPLHAPVGLAAGDVVDVWATPGTDSAPSAGAPRLVRAAAVVTEVSEDGLGIGGRLAVVISVPETDVGTVVAAAHGGTVDLVAVPPAAQDPTS